MSTIRVAKRPRYTSVDRRSINDGGLSFRARGVLVWLLDKPDDWRADATSISNGGREGRDAVRAALRELEEAGYLVRRKFRDDGGAWRTEHTLYEHPSLADQDGKPAQVDQQRLTSAGESGGVVKPSGTETETCTDTPVESILAAGFDRFWSVYPRNTAKATARGAWPAAVKAAGSMEVIIDGATRYRDDPNRVDGFTAHAATWLRGERWNDGPLPARRGEVNPRRVMDTDRDAPGGRVAL